MLLVFTCYFLSREKYKNQKKINGLLIDLDSFWLLFTKIWAPLSRFSTDEFLKNFEFLVAF